MICPLNIDGAYFYSRIMPRDSRGYFTTLFQSNWPTGDMAKEVQFNASHSKKGVFRGFHFSRGEVAEAKFVSCLTGHIIDFLWDVRPDSKTFGMVCSLQLFGDTETSVYVPPGCGHGFYAVEESTVIYATTKLWRPHEELGYSVHSPGCVNFVKEMVGDGFSEMILSDKDLLLQKLVL